MRFPYLFVLPCLAFAQQDYETLKPKEPASEEPRLMEAVEKPDVQSLDRSQALVDSLQEIVFVNDPELILSNGESEPGCVRFFGFEPPHSQKLREAVDVYLGRPLSICLLDEIRDAAADFYREEGYPIVGVSIPAGQDISEGKVVVLVLVGRVGEVRAEKARYFCNEWIAGQLSLCPGDEIRSGPLMNDLAWLNNNPFRTVNLVFEKGANLSQTNIVLETYDVRPYRIFAGYENTGNIIAGDSRVLAGFNAANLWGSGHQLNYQCMSAPSPNRWWGMSADYLAPLPWRHSFNAFGTYVLTRNPMLQDPSEPPVMDQSGQSWQLSGRYLIPLPALAYYRHNLLLGYDFKRTNNFLSFSEDLIFNNYFDIDQFIVSYDGTLEDRFGSWIWALSYFLSPGGITHFNRSSDFELERPGTKADYTYSRTTLDRITFLPKDFIWSFSSLFQWSSGKLLPSEELSLGGFMTVRGYDENEVISDRGILVKNELRSPVFSFFKRGVVRDELQFLAFADFGYAIDIDRNILDRNNVILASAGPGLRYTINPYLDFRLDYGFQLKSISNRPFVSGDHSRIHLSFVVGL